MRISVEQVKQGIVHPEPVVRNVALRYFSESFSDDPGVMPLAIQAIETYGWEDAFEHPDQLDLLAQTEETLLWLIDRLNKLGRPADFAQFDVCDDLGSAIAHADVSLLMKHEQSILGLEGLSPALREVIADRLRLLTLDSAACWEELEQLCEEYKRIHDINEFPVEQADRLCEAIARDGGSADRVLGILSEKVENYKNNPMLWLELYACRLAGEMRLEPTVPLLVGKLRDSEDDMLPDECVPALIKIGTGSAVAAICQDFAAAGPEYRLDAAHVLSDIHSDLAVAKCLELLGLRQSDVMVEAGLLRAVLQNFSTDGIELGRQYTLTRDDEVLLELVAAAILTGVSFPELEGWKAQENRAIVKRKQDKKQMLAAAPPRQTPANFRPTFQKPPAPPPIAPIRRQMKVGRNDPCPCGSGKKYKKCCMDKD